MAERPDPARTRLDSVFWVTLAYFAVEATGGVLYNSLALLTDASFMAINVAGQLLVLHAERLSARRPDRRRTFGYERAKVLSGLFNGVLIGFVLFYVFRDAYGRILAPSPIEAGKVLSISILGLAANAYAVWRLHGRAGEIHVRSAFLLALNDALGSVGITLSSALVHVTGLYAIDAVTSVVIGLLVAYPTYHLVRDSIGILMEEAPATVDVGEIERFVLAHYPDTSRVKELHVWAITPEKLVATIEVRTRNHTYNRENIKALKASLKARFGLHKAYLDVYEDGE